MLSSSETRSSSLTWASMRLGQPCNGTFTIAVGETLSLFLSAFFLHERNDTIENLEMPSTNNSSSASVNIQVNLSKQKSGSLKGS